MTDIRNQGHRTVGRTLPDLPTRIGLFGAATGAAVDASPFDVVIAIATSDPRRP